RRTPLIAFSGLTLEPIREYPPPALDDYLFMNAAGGIRDIDNDGRGDVAVWADLPVPQGAPRAFVIDIFSGATGERIRRVEQGYFTSVDSIGDLDADGVDEIVLAAWGGDGEVRIVSGATHELLRFYSTPTHDDPGAGFGTGLAVVP